MVAKVKATEKPPAPGPDTFDFDSYISGVSTFPEFTHTVYLDQASGIALASVADEYDKLAKRGRAIQRRQQVIAQSTATSLVDDEYDNLVEELSSIEAQAQELEERISELEEKVKASGVTLTFQVGTAQKLGKVVRRAEKEYQKKNGRGSDDDPEYLTDKARHVMIAQLVAYCTKITLPDGTEKNPPGAEGFARLMDSLISSESMRLMVALNKALDSSGAWAERIDAGFPGGVLDLDEESLGNSDPEDGAELVPSTADDPDGEED